MNLLLDTHVTLWWIANDRSLSDEARALIADEESFVYVSVASVWEMAIKQNLGRLDFPPDLEYQLERHTFEPLSITLAHARLAGSLPRHHNDPFDRMIVAQAMIESLTIVTHDQLMVPYGVPTLIT